MLEVKETKSAKYSITLDRDLRENIFNALWSLLEKESLKIANKKLINEYEVLHSVYCSVLNELIKRKDFKLHINDSLKWTLTKSEAIALMWLLREYDYITSMLNLKSSLHKQLTA